jgi:hypothetical protein
MTLGLCVAILAASADRSASTSIAGVLLHRREQPLRADFVAKVTEERL